MDEMANPTGTVTDNDGIAFDGNTPAFANNTVNSEAPTLDTGTDEVSAPSASTNTARD
jgi:hypothetical protein